MKTLTADIELTTPAILGGARPRRGDPYFGLRPSAVRGGLRYWFRALVASMLWPTPGKDPREQRHNDEQMLEVLRSLESDLFGNTDQRSRVVVLPCEGVRTEPWSVSKDEKGLRYLGYGLFEGTGRPERLVTGANGLALQMCLRPTRGKPASPQHDAALLDVLTASLWLWTSLGGLGARMRRGYGSMHLARLRLEEKGHSFSLPRGWDGALAVAGTNNDHLQRLLAGIGRAQDSVSGLVKAFGRGSEQLNSAGTRPHPNIRTIDGIASLRTLVGETDDPLHALDEAGRLLQSFRSSLLRSRPLPDYDAVKASLRPPHPTPAAVERAAFGLPLNFYFRSLGGEKAQFLPRPPRGRGSSELDRVASPLLVRVHALGPPEGRRRYGVTLINLAGQRTEPLLGCSLVQKRPSAEIPAPTGRLLDEFIEWAVTKSRQRPLAPRRPQRGRGGRRSRR